MLVLPQLKSLQDAFVSSEATDSKLRRFLPDSLKPLFDERHNPWLKVLGKMGDGLLVCWQGGEILWMNSVLQDKLELDPAELSSEMSPEAAQQSASPNHELAQAIQEVLETGQPVQKEIKVRIGQQRRRYFEIFALPVSEELTILDGSSDDWSGCLAVFRDITPIKNTEKMRKDFVANVSHELRTPLSVLKGYTETLLEGALQDTDVAQSFVETMGRHAERLSTLVEELLDLSRLESAESPLNLEPLRISSILERVVSMSSDSAGNKDIQLTLDPSAQNLPVVRGHGASLEQVAVNLVDNAIKYTPAGGSVKVFGDVLPDKIRVGVADNGIGISTKHIPRLFERFYRVDKARSRDLGGTGLGLSIVKHIVQAHGGDVWVESKLEQGSTFYFTLKQL